MEEFYMDSNSIGRQCGEVDGSCQIYISQEMKSVADLFIENGNLSRVLSRSASLRSATMLEDRADAKTVYSSLHDTCLTWYFRIGKLRRSASSFLPLDSINAIDAWARNSNLV